MLAIPTPSHDIPLDLRLVLVLLGLSPAMLASWSESRLRAFLTRLPIDSYSLVLLFLAAGMYLALGTPPQFLSPSVSLRTTILVGLVAGVAAIGIELSALRLWSVPGYKRRRSSPPTNEWALADVPTGSDVVWRLRDHGPAWRYGLINLLTPAILEELVYRQALLVLLAQAGGILWAAVVSTLSFGFIHLYFGAGAVVSKWIIGAILATIVLSGGGLLSTIVAHCVLNVAAYAVRTGRIKSIFGIRLVRIGA